MLYRDQLSGVGWSPTSSTDVTQLELVVSRKVTNSHDSHLKRIQFPYRSAKFGCVWKGLQIQCVQTCCRTSNEWRVNYWCILVGVDGPMYLAANYSVPVQCVRTSCSVDYSAIVAFVHCFRLTDSIGVLSMHVAALGALFLFMPYKIWHEYVIQNDPSIEAVHLTSFGGQANHQTECVTIVNIHHVAFTCAPAVLTANFYCYSLVSPIAWLYLKNAV